MDEAVMESTPKPVPWYLREVKLTSQVYGVGRPMRIFLAIFVPLLLLNAVTWKPLWQLGWRYPFYGISDILPVCSAGGTWLHGGAWVRNKTIRIVATSEVSPQWVESARRDMQGLVDELNLDLRVEALPCSADLRASIEAASLKQDGEIRLDFERLTRRRLDDRGQCFAEIILTQQKFAGVPYAAGMTHFRAGIAVLHPTARPLVVVRHEGAHLLGYDKHDDIPLFIFGYPEDAPEERQTLMMPRATGARALSPRARDALYYFWLGLQERDGIAYFKR